MSFPPLARVRQFVPQPRVADVAGTVRRLILESRLRELELLRRGAAVSTLPVPVAQMTPEDDWRSSRSARRSR